MVLEERVMCRRRRRISTTSLLWRKEIESEARPNRRLLEVGDGKTSHVVVPTDPNATALPAGNDLMSRLNNL